MNTQLTAEQTTQKSNGKNGHSSAESEAIRKGLIAAGVPEARVEISEVARLGYATDVGPISLMPLAVVGVQSHADVEKAVKYAYEHNIPITARGAGSGLPGQSVGAGIMLDMRSMTDMKVLEDHPEGGKVVFSQAGVICTRLNNYLKKYGVFLASYPASTDMATIGGMIANNSSGANSCKLGTTQHQVLDLHVVLADGTGVWTSEISSDREPWSKIVELVKANQEAIERDFPRVAKNSSGYNVLDLLKELEAGASIDWSILFTHSEGTLGVITEAKLRALPLPAQKTTCIVYFTNLQEACGAIPKIYDLGPSCFDTAVTTNLDLIRKTFPNLNIPEDAKVMYLIEFDDMVVEADPNDPARRIGRISLMEQQAAAELIAKQVKDLEALLKQYPTAMGFDVATDPAKQDALWQGRRAALQVLYAYDPAKRPLTMIECVVLPRDEQKILEFIKFMEETFEENGVVAGTHGHAGDVNFHIYLLLNLSDELDRKRLITVMTKITEKTAELGGSMSGEHADGRTRGLILPYVFGLNLFDLFVEMKNVMDAKTVLHPGVKIIPEARDKDLEQNIVEMVGIKEQDSRLNLTRFKDLSHLFTGVCAFCSKCADSCPIFKYIPDEFAARSEAAPTFKRALAIALDADGDLEKMKDDPLFEQIYDLCLLCGSCTYICPTDASMRDLVIEMREENPSKVIAPMLYTMMTNDGVYNSLITLLGKTQGIWQNKASRAIMSMLPEVFLPSPMPKERVLPQMADKTMAKRFPELVDIPAAEADVAYFYGCSSDAFANPVADSFINIARHNNITVSLPGQQCCGEPFACVGNTEEYHKFAKYNIDQFYGYKYIVAHCPSCILAFKEYAHDLEKIGEIEYAKKARAIAGKFYDPARFVLEVIGPANLTMPAQPVNQKITIHTSCHEKLGHKMSSTTNRTRELLSLIPGLEVVEMKGSDECCGAGGMWGLMGHYELSRQIRREKMQNIMDTRADKVISWCSVCVIQMRDGLAQADSEIEALNPLELLSQAYGQYDPSRAKQAAVSA